DFFNGIRHSLRIVEELHAAFPDVTYDATIKVEHVLEHRDHLPTLARTGCVFIVSAVEALHDHVLAHLQKGHTAADVDEALRLTAAVGIPIRPTFMPFTPWLSLEAYQELLAGVRSRGLVRHVDAVQYAIRMLVPRGSSLYGTASLAPYVGDFEAETFSYRWTHPDPRMDVLQQNVSAVVEAAAAEGEDATDTLVAIERLAQAAAGQVLVGGGGVLTEAVELPTAAFVPRLTEAWFC
ncbi:MAG: CUAEP/CCAEP-tail radical SAM protein, partial [Chloroflexota bacterium]